MKHTDYVFKENFHGVGIHGLIHWSDSKEFKPWYTAYVELPQYKAAILEDKIELYNMPITCNKFASDAVFFEETKQMKHVKKFNNNYVVIGIDSLHSIEAGQEYFLDQISEGPDSLKQDIKRFALILDILLRQYDVELFEEVSFLNLTKEVF